MTTESAIYHEAAEIEAEIRTLRDADTNTKARRGVEMNSALRALEVHTEPGSGLHTYVKAVRQKVYQQILGMETDDASGPHLFTWDENRSPSCRTCGLGRDNAVHQKALKAPDARIFPLQEVPDYDDIAGQISYSKSLENAEAANPEPPMLVDFGRVTRAQLAAQWREDRQRLLGALAAKDQSIAAVERATRMLGEQVTRTRERAEDHMAGLRTRHEEFVAQVRADNEAELRRGREDRNDLRKRNEKLTTELHRALVQVEALTTALSLEITVDVEDGNEG